ncbi:hypothetical protein F66182_9878 [Fusarium sp. NRRL 66182]|nr:hypothetical protein F66182_9878 [Fusarium sp. NRRL 66182]
MILLSALATDREQTPTPRRFLLAKRGAQSSQTPTAPPRFHATPRFASSSVPRLTQARAGIDIEDVEEGEGNTQESLSESEDIRFEPRKNDPLHDSIEVESDDVTASQEGSIDISDDEPEVAGLGLTGRETLGSPSLSHESPPLEEREPKRRRVSVSPMQESSPVNEYRRMADDTLEETLERGRTPPQSSTQSVQDAGPPHDQSKAVQQPTFRAPPRFKPIELDPAVEGLPAAFSPQRRGAKYVVGGLAAELQGWLSEAKGWEGLAPSATSVMKVTIEEIRPGRRMYLVKGQTGGASGQRFLLAGSGRLTGLGQRMAVGVGSVVEVGRPVWDIRLDDEVWTVACDWGVS